MKYKMHLKNGPFNRIKEGKKTIELRINDEKRQLLKERDLIEFINGETLETMIVEIKSLYRSSNFEELYKCFDKMSVEYDENDLESPKDMEQYYSKEELDKYGVIGIEMRVLSDRK